MDRIDPETAINDLAFLSRADHRIPMLLALAVRPRSRSELQELTGVSSSTIRRTIREFEERNWTRRTEYQFETTILGDSVAEGVGELLERLDTERSVRDVWELLPNEESGFSINMCAGAEVTVADSENPYRPVERFRTLLSQTSTFRAVGFEVAIFDPCRDDLCDRITAGMETELLVPPRVPAYLRERCPELIKTTLETGNLTVRVHDDLPHFGVCLFDECISVRGYDDSGVSLRVLIDTDAESAREWAESIYETYQRQTPTIPLQLTED